MRQPRAEYDPVGPETAPQGSEEANGGHASRESARALILDSAIRELAKSGFHHVRIEDIAAGAGVSTGLLNYHFGSRRRLLAAALIAGIRHRPADPETSARELLERGLADMSTASDGWWRIRLDALRLAVYDAEVRAAVEQATAELVDSVSRLLGGREQDGRDARLLVAMVDGLRQRAASGMMTQDEAQRLFDSGLGRIRGE